MPGVGEQQDREQSPPEDRHGIAGDRHGHHAMIEDRVALSGGEDTGGESDQDREEHGRKRELDGGGKQLLELRDHGLMGDQRASEIAAEDMADVCEILDIERAVEAVLVQQLLVTLRGNAALARQRLDGIAGNGVDQQEREQRDPDKGRDDQSQPGEDETQHDSKNRPAGLSLPPRRPLLNSPRRYCRSTPKNSCWPNGLSL